MMYLDSSFPYIARFILLSSSTADTFDFGFILQWIDKEIVRLQRLIDRANDKGWRREYPSKYFIYIHAYNLH